MDASIARRMVSARPPLPPLVVLVLIRLPVLPERVWCSVMVIGVVRPRDAIEPEGGGADDRRMISPISVARRSSAVCRSSAKKRGAGDGAATWVSSWAMMPVISAVGRDSADGIERWMTSPVVAATLSTEARARCDASLVDTSGRFLPTMRLAMEANWVGNGLGRS